MHISKYGAVSVVDTEGIVSEVYKLTSVGLGMESK